MSIISGTIFSLNVYLAIHSLGMYWGHECKNFYWEIKKKKKISQARNKFYYYSKINFLQKKRFIVIILGKF